MKTLSQLNVYSTSTVSYTDQGLGSGQVLGNRYQINGLLDTSKPVLENIELMCSAAASWLSYDILEGKWGVVINQTGTSVASFNESNIIGSISLSGTGLTDLYNSSKVEFPHRDLRDSSDFIKTEIPSGDRNANEPDNTLNITYDIINEPVQAQLLGLIELKQSRIDLVISFRTDFEHITVKAGDIVDVTDSRFGFINKLFRIITTTEVQDDDGALMMELTALEYNADVYSTADLYRYTRTDENGIIGIGAIGVPGTPQVTKFEQDARPRVLIESLAPTGVVEGLEYWLSNDVSIVNDDNRSYRLIATQTPVGGGVFATGANVTVEVDTLGTSNFLIKTRGFNATTVGPYSSPSGFVYFAPVQTTDAIGPQTGAIGGLLAGLAVLDLIKAVDGVFTLSTGTSSIFKKIMNIFTTSTGVDLEAAASSGSLGGTNTTSTVVVSNPLTIRDEGNLLTGAASAINFVGPAVTASSAGGVVSVYVDCCGTGSGGSGQTETLVCHLQPTSKYPPDRTTYQDPTTGVTSDQAPISGSYYILFNQTITTSSLGSSVINGLVYGAVTAGTGNAKLYKSDGTLVETLAAADLEYVNNRVGFPFAIRELGTDYYILLDEGLIKYCDCISSAIGEKEWNFNTPAYETAVYNPSPNLASKPITTPSIISITPSSPNTSTFVCSNGNLIITYNRPVLVGGGNVFIKKESDDTIVQTIAASTGILSTSGFAINFGALSLTTSSQYYITADNGIAIASISGGDCYSSIGTLSSAINKASNYKINTYGLLEYVNFIVSSLPVTNTDTGKIKVNPQTNIGIIFNRPIAFGTGNITIKRSDGTTHQAISVTTSFNANKTNELIWIDGNTVWINPTKDLLLDTDYYINIASGAIIDSCGLVSWSGINNSTSIRWHTDPGPVTSTPPAINTSTRSIDLSYDRPIQAGTGTLKILNSSGTVVATIASTSTLVTYK